MKVEISKLGTPAMDYVVACAVYGADKVTVIGNEEVYVDGDLFTPCDNHAQGRPLMDDANIITTKSRDGGWLAAINDGQLFGVGIEHGATALMAGMRCLANAKFGSHVEVPDGLLENTLDK